MTVLNYRSVCVPR